MNTAICSKCKQTKPLCAFPSGTKRTGRSSWCRKCTNANTVRYQFNRTKRFRVLEEDFRAGRRAGQIEHSYTEYRCDAPDGCKRERKVRGLVAPECCGYPMEMVDAAIRACGGVPR